MEDLDHQPVLLVIGGATASGKTAAAIRLAQLFGAPVLSADSRQFYREMSIGTAKPSPEERAAARHYFIDSLSVEDPYSVGDFERDALRVLEEVFRKHRVAILVGGSGLFLQAVYAGLDTFPAISDQTKTVVRSGEATGGLAWLQEQVALHDPVYFHRADRNNPARLRRALEVCYESGQPYSAFLEKPRAPRFFRSILLLLELPRPELYRRIDQRVDRMIEAGLEEEARQLIRFRHLPALRTVGYEEWFDYFDGKQDRGTTINKIKQHSRNYAKRQATWFRKHGEWQAFHPDDLEEMEHFCREKIGEKT